MHKVFVSFHHANDQKYKEGLVSWAEKNKVFIDGSVDMGEIPEDWDDQKIREYIRDEHLKDTTVTILLVGTETKNRLPEKDAERVVPSVHLRHCRHAPSS